MKITDYGFNGEGVGRLNGKVCFVPYTIISEDVDVEIIKENAKLIKARPKKFISQSTLRRNAPCPYFGQCGGCDFQHIDYEEELRIKKEILNKHFAKIKHNCEINVVKSPEIYRYRNKIKLVANEKGLGLRKFESHEIINIDQCLLVDENMNKTIQQLNNFLIEEKYLKNIEEVIINKNDKKINVFIKNKSKNIIKNKNLLNLNIFYENKVAFKQVNDGVCELLYNAVINQCGERILNAYSGAGTLSAILAEKSKYVCGVEIGEEEHKLAEKLKDDLNITNLKNILGDCALILPKLREKFDTIIVDPPRGGCEEKVLNAIDNFNANKLIYISCNPATLIRDLKLLKNYEINSISLFDMFPRTANFETLTILTKK